MMKKLFIIGLALTAIACVKSEEKPIKPTTDKPIITLSASHEVATRVLLGEDDSSLNWEATDALSVFDADGDNNKFELTEGTGTSAALFEGPAGDAPYYAIYPYNASATISSTNITTSFPTEQTLAEGKLNNDAAIMVGKSENIADGIGFYNAFAVLKFSLKGTGLLTGISVRAIGGEKLSGEVSVDAASATPALAFDTEALNYILADLQAPVQLDGTEKVFYLIVPAQDYTQGLEINFKTNEGVHVRRTKAMAIARNSNTGTGVTTVIDTPYDLSTRAGAETQETANSYVVEPLDILLYGYNYRFPADVMGNGVFDRDGFTLSSVGGADAELLWQEQPQTIKSLALVNDYIEFEIGDVKGNASVAATAGGSIKWSWHIWLPKTAIQEHTYDVTSQSRQTLQDRNLGALSTEIPDALHESNDTYGLYYQFGRKDPFTRANIDGTSRVVGDTYDFNGVELASFADNQDATTGMMQTTDKRAWSKFDIRKDYSIVQGTIEDAIAHPMWFFGVTNNQNSNNWYRAATPEALGGTVQYNRNLWDNSASISNTASIKTAFDPCPRGWKIPFRQTLRYAANVGRTLAQEYRVNAASRDGVTDKGGYSFVINAAGDVAWFPTTGFIQYAPTTGAPNYVYPTYAIYLWASYMFSASPYPAGTIIRYNYNDFGTSSTIDPDTGLPINVEDKFTKWAETTNFAKGSVRPSYGAQVRCQKI